MHPVPEEKVGLISGRLLEIDRVPLGLLQVLIRLGSTVMIPGKIMHRMSPNIMSSTNGVCDL